MSSGRLMGKDQFLIGAEGILSTCASENPDSGTSFFRESGRQPSTLFSVFSAFLSPRNAKCLHAKDKINNSQIEEVLAPNML